MTIQQCSNGHVFGGMQLGETCGRCKEKGVEVVVFDPEEPQRPIYDQMANDDVFVGGFPEGTDDVIVDYDEDPGGG